MAVFDDEQSLNDAVYVMATRGFDRAAFSLLATEQAVSEKLGHRYQCVAEMEDEAKAPRETSFRAFRVWKPNTFQPRCLLQLALWRSSASGLDLWSLSRPAPVLRLAPCLVG